MHPWHQCHTPSGLLHRRSQNLSSVAGKPVFQATGCCVDPSDVVPCTYRSSVMSGRSGSVCTFQLETWGSDNSLCHSSSSLEQWLKSSRRLGCDTWCRGSLMISCVRWFYWPDSDQVFSSWNIHPSEGHWTLVPLWSGQHTQEGSDWLLLVERWSRGALKEADSPRWDWSAAHPQRPVLLYQSIFYCS